MNCTGRHKHRFKWWWAVLAFAVAALVLGLVGGWAAAGSIPALQARVNDYAHLLTPATAKSLEKALLEFEKSDSTQIVVLTVTSLEGESLEGYSLKVAETWKVGQEGLDNGAILLIAKKERKVRIEVGYGLEGSLTDMISGRIIRNVIVPAFKAGNFDQGVANGVAAMMAAVKGEYQAQAAKDRPRGRDSSVSFIPLIVFIFLITQLGRVRRGLGVVAGGLLLPIFGTMILPVGLMTLLLIPLGLVAGFVLSLVGSALGAAGAASGRGRGGGFWIGGSGGGFSSGGFGGFSGGGGGFGGGGASGGW